MAHTRSRNRGEDAGVLVKLVFCSKCQDVYKLDFERRTCKCGQTWGQYAEDGLHATFGGISAYPLGFNNMSLITAVAFQPTQGVGQRFESFVIPKLCETMLFVDDSE
jgi:hypothetical protein